MPVQAKAQLSAWLERLIHRGRDWSSLGRSSHATLAFSPPDYLGVTESTRRFFSHWSPLSARDLLMARDRARFVEAVVSASPRAVVFSGFDGGYREVLEALRTDVPSLRIFVLWHASPMQLTEGCNRQHFESILELGRRGVISRVGCFKTGMGETLVRLGLAAQDVFNPPPSGEPRGMDVLESSVLDRATRTAEAVPDSEEDDAAIRLGIFLAGPSWRKNPYAMLDAAARLGPARITGVLDREARRWAEVLGLDTQGVSAFPFGRAALERAAARQSCNLYVGLSECSPLFPLESLHWGVPCLIGPTSHLFVRSPLDGTHSESTHAEAVAAASLLEERLVVDRPEDPDAIAAAIPTAIEAREEILSAYGVWERAYRSAAWASMEALLGSDLPRGLSS